MFAQGCGDPDEKSGQDVSAQRVIFGQRFVSEARLHEARRRGRQHSASEAHHCRNKNAVANWFGFAGKDE